MDTLCTAEVVNVDIKIAFASSDGVTVNEHFGRASRFLIFRLHKSGHDFLEERENYPSCAGQEHSDDLLEISADLISDCKGVVVSQIGPGAIDLLIERGIMPFTLPGRIDEALAVVAKSKVLTKR